MVGVPYLACVLGAQKRKVRVTKREKGEGQHELKRKGEEAAQ